jgi:hypothetical protein
LSEERVEEREERGGRGVQGGKTITPFFFMKRKVYKKPALLSTHPAPA